MALFDHDMGPPVSAVCPSEIDPKRRQKRNWSMMFFISLSSIYFGWLF